MSNKMDDVGYSESNNQNSESNLGNIDPECGYESEKETNIPGLATVALRIT